MINLFISQNVVLSPENIYIFNISTYYPTLIKLTYSSSGELISQGYPAPTESGVVVPYLLTLKVPASQIDFGTALLGVGVTISQERSKSTNQIVSKATFEYRILLSKDTPAPVYDYTLSCPNPSGNYVLTMQKQNNPTAIIINLGSCTTGNYFLYSGKFDTNYTSGTKVTITGSSSGGVNKTYNLTLKSGENVFVV
jgi:hypothetical protein